MVHPIKRFRIKIQQDAIDDLDAIYSLRDLPRRGSRVRLLESQGAPSPGEIRFIEYRGYLVFYTIEKREVIILHVTGPGKNWIQWFL